MPTEESAPAPARPAPGGGRRRWIARVLLVALLLPVVGHYVYTRWTAVPAGSGAAPPGQIPGLDPPKDDAAPELLAAIETMPTVPRTAPPPPPPEGFVWVDRNSPTTNQVLDVRSVLSTGEWEPETRWLLAQAVAYLQQPACTQALDRVVALSGRRFSCSLEQLPGQPSIAQIRHVGGCLIGRARLKIDGGDWRGAFQDLEACFNLGTSLAANSTLATLIFGGGLRNDVVIELKLLAHEFELTREQADDLRELLRRNPFRVHRAWRRAVRGELEIKLRELDRYYTGRRGEDGFYVPSSEANSLGFAPPRAFNLCSPLYDSRPQMEAYCHRLLAWAERRISDAEPRWENYPLTLPPFAREWWTECVRMSAFCWRSRALQDSAAVMIAANLWAQEHGSYPQAPSQLPLTWRSLWLSQEEIPPGYPFPRYDPETGACYVVDGEDVLDITRREPYQETILVEAERVPGSQ